MQDFIMNAIRNSDLIAVGTVRRSGTVTVEGHEFVRIEMARVEFYKGNPPRERTLTIDVRAAGKETPEIQVSREYLFFLSAPDSPLWEGRSWRLVNLTQPVEIPSQQRDQFLRCLRESTRLYSVTPSGAEMKQHLLKMLRSGIDFFQSDASRVANTVSDWGEIEIEDLIAILSGKSGPGLVGANERDNVMTVVVQYGSASRVTSFARLELEKENSDPVYYGLFKRGGQDVDTILWSLLKDTGVHVQVQALRVAGLLRRVDILDSFEKQLEPNADTRIRAALGSARALANRD